MASSKEKDVRNALQFSSSLDTQSDQPQDCKPNLSVPGTESDDHHRLSKTVENEIIPRLVLAHSQLTSHQRNFNAPNIAKYQISINEIARLSVEGNKEHLRNEVNALLNQNIGLEELFIDVLAPAAGVLGTQWETDELNFMEVSLAIGSLQTLLHELSDRYQHEASSFASDRRVLIISTPGEQHTFGVSMVAEVFRRRGWYVDSNPISDLDALSQHVQSEWFDVVGLSLSAESFLKNCVEGIRRIRRGSRNQRVGIMVGGPVFNMHPDWLTKVGADALGHDAIQAEEQAHRLIGLLVQGSG